MERPARGDDEAWCSVACRYVDGRVLNNCAETENSIHAGQIMNIGLIRYPMSYHNGICTALFAMPQDPGANAGQPSAEPRGG